MPIISTSSDHLYVLYSLVLGIPGIFLMLFEVSIRRKNSFLRKTERDGQYRQ